MEYCVYADLSRSLMTEEQSAVFAALEVSVPGSGCVGRDKTLNDEVYFCVVAHREEDARVQAYDYMNIVLQQARLDVAYTITLQAKSWLPTT